MNYYEDKVFAAVKEQYLPIVLVPVQCPAHSKFLQISCKADRDQTGIFQGIDTGQSLSSPFHQICVVTTSLGHEP